MNLVQLLIAYGRPLRTQSRVPLAIERPIGISTGLSVASSVVLGATLMGMSLAPAAAETQPQATFSSWIKACDGPAANGRRSCTTYNEGLLDSGTIGVAAALTEGGGRSTLRVTLPLGMSIQPGTRERQASHRALCRLFDHRLHGRLRSGAETHRQAENDFKNEFALYNNALLSLT
jgi:hypothetical protein